VPSRLPTSAPEPRPEVYLPYHALANLGRQQPQQLSLPHLQFLRPGRRICRDDQNAVPDRLRLRVRPNHPSRDLGPRHHRQMLAEPRSQIEIREHPLQQFP